MTTPSLKLYEITAAIRAIGDEDLTPQEATAKFLALEGKFEDKVRGVIAFALELQAEAAVRETHGKRMLASVKPMLAKADAMLDYAQIQIQNVEMPLPMRFPEFTVNLAKMPPKTDVFNEDVVPDEYKTRTVTVTLKTGVSVADFEAAAAKALELCVEHSSDVSVSKAAIMADLKEGVQIEGAQLEPLAYRLTVK